jgi:hypothetical protein
LTPATRSAASAARALVASLKIESKGAWSSRASLAPDAFLGVYQPAAGLPVGSRATAVVTGATVDAQFAVICNESSSTTFMSYNGQ